MNRHDKDVFFHLAGWILFLICAFLFLFVAVRDHDVTLALASLLFLGGCVVFLVPLLFHRSENDKAQESGEDRPGLEEK